MYDVIIVGGGPAGLSAAMVLGRCRRKVVVFDHGRPRNRHSHGVHGFLSRDGVEPLELLRLGRQEIARYGVELREAEVVDAACTVEGVHVVLRDGQRIGGRRLLLATGLCDDLPDIPGVEALYGVSVHHCPYCDGWEWRDQRIAVYGRGKSGAALALQMLTWTEDVVLCTDGDGDCGSPEHQRLAELAIPCCMHRIARLEAEGPWLRRIVFDDGSTIDAAAMFFASSRSAGCDLPERLGCQMLEPGVVDTSQHEETNVPNLWVAGDASKDVQFAIVAAAEGAKAAVAINQSLQERERLRV